jgi:histidinol phosphatase-like enzyme
MIEQALADHAIDLARAYIIGDQTRDIELAHEVGIKSVLVTTGPAGRRPLMDLQVKGIMPDRTAASLAEAADWVFSDAAGVSTMSPQVHFAPGDG